MILINPLLLLGWQRYAVYGALAVALLAVAWVHGYSRGERKLWEYQAEQAKAAVPIIVKQGETTERVVTRWREKQAEVKVVTQTVEKEVIRYVPPSADPVLGLGWVYLHDAAASGDVPKPPEGVDVSSPAVAASEALQGVVGNYGTCHGTALQLMALQEWVRAQYQVMNLRPLGY